MKKSLVLLIITLLVASYVWYFEVRPESRISSTDEIEQASKTLSGLRKQQMTGFAITKAGGETIAVERIQDDWVLSSPVRSSSDDAAVNSVLADLEWTEKDATISPEDLTEDKLASFGLTEPAGTVSVTSAEGTTVFIIGGRNLEGSRVYVRAGETGPVHLVTRKFADNLNLTVFEMRNKNVVDIPPIQVGYLRIYGRSKAALEKEGDDWNLMEPFDDHADPAVVKSVLEAAAALKIVDFVDEAPESLADYGLENSESYVSLAETASGGNITTVEFGNPVPADDSRRRLIYAKSADGENVFTVEADKVERLFAPVDRLQSKMLVRMDRFMLKNITLAAGLDQIELNKPDYDWLVSKPYEAAADAEAVSKLIDVFENAEVVQFVTPKGDLAKYGLNAPRGGFTFTEADSAPLGLVFGAPAEDGLVYVKRTDTPSVFTVSSAVFDALKTPAIEMHTRDMQAVNMLKVESVTIAREDRTYVLEPAKGMYGFEGWRLTEPVAAGANEELMAQLYPLLSNVRATQIVTQDVSDLSLFELDIPVVTVGFKTVEGEETPSKLLVGATVDGGARYAMLEGGSVVFTIDIAFAGALLRELRDTAVFSFPIGEVESALFTKGDDRYEFKKTEEGWQLVSSEDAVAKGPSVTKALALLTSTNAARFVTFETSELAKYGLEKPQAVARVVSPSGVAALSIGDMAPTGHYYAVSSLVDGIFLLMPGDVMTLFAPEKLVEPIVRSNAVDGGASSTGEGAGG